MNSSTKWMTPITGEYHMSHVMRKPTFCICENKDADQLRGNRAADQCLCFFATYEGDPRSNANTSVISYLFGISKNGLHVYYDILLIL